MKRFNLSILFLLISFYCFSAARYLVAGGTGNWNSTTNWSATDGGASGASFPTSADNAYLTTASANANITVNVSSACLTFECSGTYAGTLTATSTLAVSGTVTLVSTMTITGAGTLSVLASATLTSAGKTWTGIMQFGGTSQTYTLADNWTVSGNCNTSTATTLATVNGNTLYVGGTFYANRSIAGTTNIICNGSGDVASLGSVSNNLTINTAGSYTISTLTIAGGVFTYTAGTITGTPTLIISSSCTLNTAGINWTTVTCGVTATITNNSLLTATTLSWTGAGAATNAFLGTTGFTVGTWTTTTGTQRTYTLKAGLTYTINTAFTSVNGGIPTVRNKIQSNTGGSKANIKLTQGATQDLTYMDFTDIDASTGKTLCTYKGVITTSTNCRLLPVDVQAVSY